jgi:hypothetical protein
MDFEDEPEDRIGDIGGASSWRRSHIPQAAMEVKRYLFP